MRIDVRQRDQVTVVQVEGSIDGATAPELEQALRRELEAGHVRLVLGMGGVDYTSSAGLRVLLGTVKEARAQGGDLRVAEVREHVRKVLDLSGFTGIIKFFPDVPLATASYAG